MGFAVAANAARRLGQPREGEAVLDLRLLRAQQPPFVQVVGDSHQLSRKLGDPLRLCLGGARFRAVFFWCQLLEAVASLPALELAVSPPAEAHLDPNPNQ